MRRTYYITIAVFLSAAMSFLYGCGKIDNFGLDPKSPVVITVWHAYNAVAKAQFDKMVMEYNETEGLEQGIVVETVGYGSSEELEEVLYSSANHVIGSDPLPDIFAAYPDSAYRLNEVSPLVSLNEYYTDEELLQYRTEFLAEGIWSAAGDCKMLPVSKSTELLYLNTTEWERFSGDTGASKDMLSTWEGLSKAAGMYYEWSVGSPFLGINSYNDFAVLAAAQLGIQVYQVKDDTLQFEYPVEAAKRAWDVYYVPHIKGWFESSIYNQDGIKSGKLLAYIGSSAGAGFFPKEVIEDENRSHPIECESLSYPFFEDGEAYMTQRGANMAVFKSDRASEYASVQFLKWFTAHDQNISFAISTGYLPVREDALQSVNELLGQVKDSSNEEMVKSSIRTSMAAMMERKFYIRKPFEGSYDLTKIFASSLEKKVAMDLAELNRRIESGEDREKAEEVLLEADNFDSWYRSLMKEMAGKLDE